MGLEDRFCPCCGKPNPFAKQHQAEMRKYRNSYEETRQEVLKKSRRFAAYGAKLTLLAILLAANLAAVILAVNAWDIGYSLREKRIAGEAPAHRENLEQFLSEGDYAGLAGYMQANDVSYAESFDDLSAVSRAASLYQSILTDLMDAGNRNEYRFREEYRAESCRYLAKNIQDLYNVEQSYSYRAERYLSEENLAHIGSIRRRVELLLQSTLGFTEEEAAEARDLSIQRLSERLAERIGALPAWSAEPSAVSYGGAFSGEEAAP